MPIIHIHSLPQKSESDVANALQTLADTVAKEMNIPPYTVRCVWNEVKSGFYVQGGSPTEAPENRGSLVSFTLFEGRSADFVQNIQRIIADILSHTLGIDPKTVCIVCYEHKFYQVLDKGQCFTIKYPTS
jgi:phenylpyruvate tautomerase PptA (4-oxalocrotonate tautomerase family)